MVHKWEGHGGDIRERGRSIYTLTCTNRPVCFSISNILAWNTGSTASTLTPYNSKET